MGDERTSWQATARRVTLILMDTAPIPAERADTTRPKTEAECQDRTSWEAEGIAEARAEIAAGFYVDIADVRVWVDSLRTDAPLPLPPIRHS